MTDYARLLLILDDLFEPKSDDFRTIEEILKEAEEILARNNPRAFKGGDGSIVNTYEAFQNMIQAMRVFDAWRRTLP